MRRLSLAFPLALFALLAASAARPALAQKEFGFDNRKGSGQPYLKPAETVAKFKVADEFEVKLFAGEPDCINPVAFTIDEKGRVWVVECFEYPKRTPPGKAPRDRIVILEDTDGDGVCDKRTVFAEGKDFPVPEERKKANLGAFDLCTGIEVGHGGVFVGAAPYLYFIENKNDKPGKFEVLLKGFGSQDTHETLNTFQWGPDGWLYGLHGVFTQSNVKPLDGPETRMNAAIWRYHPKLKKFEIFAEGTSNPWGLDWRNTDGQFVLACCVIPHLYHIVPGGIYKRQAGASYNPHAYGYIQEICDHTFHKESGWAHAGLISLDVPHMPKRFQNSVIFGSIHGCSIKQNVLKPNGSTYTASRGDDFLVSGDKNFRPINMKWGPAGDIYLIDWHDQNPCHQTKPDDWDYERGRVYRIQLKGTKTKKAEDLGKKTDGELMDVVLKGTDPYSVRQALRVLSERSAVKVGKDSFPKEGIAAVRAALASKDPVQELRAMWLMRAVRYSAPQLRHTNASVRAWSTRILEPSHLDINRLQQEATELAATEETATVRRELASAAIRLSEKHDVTPLLRALMARKEDAKDPVIPHLVWLAYEKVLAKASRERGEKGREKGRPPAADAPGSSVQDELAWLAKEAPDNVFVRDQIVPKVMRRLVATGNATDLKLCVEFVAKLKDAASREKALDGLAVALDKQTVNAPDAWFALQAEIAKDNNPKLVALANKLAVSFRDPAALKRAMGTLLSTKFTEDQRAEAARQLAAIRAPEGVPVLLNALTADKSELVRAEVVRALAAFDHPRIVPALLDNWKEFPKGLRPEVVNTLATRKEWARALLEAMAEKKIDRAEVTDNTILRVQAFNDKELNALIEKAWGRTRTTPAELAKLIDKTRDSLYEAPASFERGRKVFENNCAKCHKFDGKGAEVGPALEGAGRDIEYILGNVLDPNRVIGAPYFLRTARLLDETVFQGILAEEDDAFITLKIENGVLKKIKKADLAEPVRVAEKSLMPEGLGYNMTAQDFRDLVRYLMANPYITDVKLNTGEKFVSFGAPGRIVVPDAKGDPTTIRADVTAPGAMKARLLIGSSGDYTVRVNGREVGTGKGAGKDVRPDRDAFEIELSGTQTLEIVLKGAGPQVVYARFLDPDRKLRYPDAGAKK
ncbi:MAG: c-type cytochrome [Planctomycetes bacterium]|nr:c-type cytochrome [Planctomycetota bacterium]